MRKLKEYIFSTKVTNKVSQASTCTIKLAKKHFKTILHLKTLKQYLRNSNIRGYCAVLPFVDICLSYFVLLISNTILVIIFIIFDLQREMKLKTPAQTGITVIAKYKCCRFYKRSKSHESEKHILTV